MVQKNVRLLIVGMVVLTLGCAVLVFTLGRSDLEPTLTPEQIENMPGDRDPVPAPIVGQSAPTLMPGR